eukprot:CAMPEP_0174366408 /NCGR_PEP_ID=MMETSP0811_2-20130205/81075_1 /TAXON_ID=73025 ORGANISM="Eutreptiella gymnastica-like, Strain CCMP1594" /NCGR_SAMPLE_ID=MMETSP0811_2 /ASSEMBLY_ACC=CAM_ASM_000667 /LENGTH=199 /DNA_ID=CAMNT_0015507929 /DNA_START=418 /DNA_END=1014 /DNA_ORIENTATION=+
MASGVWERSGAGYNLRPLLTLIVTRRAGFLMVVCFRAPVHWFSQESAAPAPFAVSGSTSAGPVFRRSQRPCGDTRGVGGVTSANHRGAMEFVLWPPALRWTGCDPLERHHLRPHPAIGDEAPWAPARNDTIVAITRPEAHNTGWIGGGPPDTIQLQVVKDPRQRSAWHSQNNVATDSAACARGAGAVKVPPPPFAISPP